MAFKSLEMVVEGGIEAVEQERLAFSKRLEEERESFSKMVLS